MGRDVFFGEGTQHTQCHLAMDQNSPFLHFNPRQLLRGSESVALSPVKRRQLTRHDLRHVEGDVSHWHHGHVVLQMIVSFCIGICTRIHPLQNAITWLGGRLCSMVTESPACLLMFLRN